MRNLILGYAERRGIEITIEAKTDMLVTSREFTKTYVERAPAYGDVTWASWWAFRLLPADELSKMEDAVRELFEEYRKSKRTWASYNHEKRRLLHGFLTKG